MEISNETIFISGSKETIEAIQKEIERHEGSKSQLTERNNLDGGPATWIMVGSIALQVLPLILNFIKEMANLNHVKKIKIGDIEIENPNADLINSIKDKMEKDESRGNK